MTSTVISSTVFNAFTADIATGLSTCIAKDGQSACTARIPFASGLSTGAATPFILTNGQAVSVALTSQTSGPTTLTVPDFAGVVDEFTFKTKAQTMSNKTFVAPALGTPASGVLTNATGLPEGGLTLTDVATNNASTSNHGFLKKLSNTATEFMNGAGNWATPAGEQYGDARFEIINTSKNLADASTTQAISGVGFTPKAVMVIAADQANTTTCAWGFAENSGSAEENCIAGSGDAAFLAVPKTVFLFLYDSLLGGTQQSGTINSWDSDGITIGWTKSGSPTGTVSFYLFFFR